MVIIIDRRLIVKMSNLWDVWDVKTELDFRPLRIHRALIVKMLKLMDALIGLTKELETFKIFIVRLLVIHGMHKYC